MFNLLVICGPTASGKTKLAVQIAAKHHLEIISVDSRQVYQGLDIGTGKDLHEYNHQGVKIPVHLIDVEKPNNVYGLYRFQKEAYQKISEISQKSNSAILCGGTGLYMESILKNYSIANVPENIPFREKYSLSSMDELKFFLSKLPNELISKTDASSKKRIVRALEINEYAKSHEVIYSKKPDLDFNPYVFCLNPEKEFLSQKIRTRLENRIENGLIEEVKTLLGNGISQERLIQLGMEYKFVTLYLLRELNREEMVEVLYREILGLAKQQRTYFRGMERRGTKITWLQNPDFEEIESHLGFLTEK